MKLRVKMRDYQAEDLDSVIRLFRETVSRVNARDYSSRQIVAWLGSDTDEVRARWQTSLLAHKTLVMVEGEALAGFADMASSGYLDRLYVSADHQGEGIATALVRALEGAVSVRSYLANASITARPFFEAKGYHVLKQNTVVRDGVELINFTMVKDI
ncbi:GNAT family N-acetyltransferase [Levilactobacillus brevis]|uniref:GNAT family N-acetyltransferase n=1 Tax=Levilactobacillus brevis TaxID=1580 RepID=UPI001CDB830A|nr:GNAT family N-acetyltransferase [Levilactobacillus brevis]